MRMARDSLASIWAARETVFGMITTSLRSEKCLAAFPVLLIGLCALLLLRLIWMAASNTPFADEFHFTEVYSYVADDTTPRIADVVALHYGHPYEILKAIFLATLVLGLPWCWMMYAQVPLLGVAAFMSCLQLDSRRVSWCIVVPAIVLSVMSPRLWENLYWAMQISAALALVLGIVSFHFLSRYAHQGRPSLLVGALAAAMVGTLNTGQGLLAFAIVIAAALLLSRGPHHSLSIAAVGLAGSAIFVASRLMTPRPLVGPSVPNAGMIVRHVTLMFANAVAVFEPSGSRLALLTGFAMLLLVAYCSRIALADWRSRIFELCALAWGTATVIIVTLSRLSNDVNQPDAPRYVELVLPLVIGCLLILAKSGKRAALVLFSVVLAWGFAHSARSELHMAPYRKAFQAAALTDLCVNGHVRAFNLPQTDIRTIQKIFCRQTSEANQPPSQVPNR